MMRVAVVVALCALSSHADVAGLVVDAATGLPLAGATVTAQKLGERTSARADADGRFVIPDWGAGRYPVGASVPGYYSVRINPAFGPFASMNPLVIRLHRAATLAGTVRMRDGRAVSGVDLEFRAGDNAETTRTDPMGRYFFRSLPPGEAKLEVVVAAEMRARLRLPAVVAYPHPLKLAPGEDLTRIDFAIAPDELVTVKGRVIDPETNKPLEGGDVELMPRAECRITKRNAAGR